MGDRHRINSQGDIGKIAADVFPVLVRAVEHRRSKTCPGPVPTTCVAKGTLLAVAMLIGREIHLSFDESKELANELSDAVSRYMKDKS